jgi:hypothetical protein
VSSRGGSPGVYITEEIIALGACVHLKPEKTSVVQVVYGVLQLWPEGCLYPVRVYSRNRKCEELIHFTTVGQ